MNDRINPVPPRRAGFTLIELAIVIAIIALVVGMGMSSMTTMRASAESAETRNKLDVIERALASFRLSHGRLPCPGDILLLSTDLGYGEEADDPGRCRGGSIEANYVMLDKTVEGAVPIKALGLPDSYLSDGWGRRFSYAVDIAMTEPAAFDTVSPQETCEIPVHAVDDTARTSGAAYVLLSYGPNGHGGRTNNAPASRLSGSTNADELKNCHCNSSAADATYVNYVDKSITEGSGTGDVYDDVIRYKERWQLQDASDDDKFAYKGPQMAAIRRDGGTATLYTYRHNCGGVVQTPPTPTTLGTASRADGLVFTPGNTHIFTYMDAGSTQNNCKFFRISDNTLTDVSNASGVGNDVGSVATTCPAYSGSEHHVAMSDNGYLAVSNGSNFRLWKQSGDALTFLADIAVVTTGAVSFEPEDISFSRNGEYMLLADNTNVVLYRLANDGRSFTPYAALPTAPSNIASATLSPNGKYVALTTTDATAEVNLWHLDRAGFPRVDTADITDGAFNAESGVSATATQLTFTPDGRYLIVGDDGSQTNGVYKLNPLDVFTPIPFGVSGISAVSADSMWIRSGDELWRRSDADSYNLVVTWPGGVSTSLDFSTLGEAGTLDLVAFAR